MTRCVGAAPRTARLSRAYAARGGAPVVSRVELAIFERRYFGACLDCGFCGDACCTHGVDVEEPCVARILARAEELEPLVGLPRTRWFDGPPVRDPDFPGGAYRRTAVVDGACVFRARGARGCLLHAHALRTGADYHETKPLVSTLFPITFAGRLLCVSDEVRESGQEAIVCAGSGPTVYETQRGELAYYFGAALVEELDRVAARMAARGRAAAPGRRALDVLG